MSKQITFYFDFISPYAYLGSVAIERLASRYNYRVDWKPILLGISVLKVMGLKGAADTPLKREYVHHDVVRFARYLDIPFKRATEKTMAPLPAARAFVWLYDQDPQKAQAFARAVFRAQWAEATDMSTPEALMTLAPPLDIDPIKLRAVMADDAVKQRLKEHVDSAIARGVFGVPTFVADGEMFWGADRVPMVERWLETGGW